MKLHEVEAKLNEFKKAWQHSATKPSREDCIQDWSVLLENHSDLFQTMYQESDSPLQTIGTCILLGFYFRDWLESERAKELDVQELRNMFRAATPPVK